MLNQFQESLLVTDRTRPLRPAYAQMAIGLALVIAIAAFGLFSASHAKGEDRKAANVPPPAVSADTPAPAFDWTLATGDGGAAIALENR